MIVFMIDRFELIQNLLIGLCSLTWYLMTKIPESKAAKPQNESCIFRSRHTDMIFTW